MTMITSVDKILVDLTRLVRNWDAEWDAMKVEQAKWPMNHCHHRIYSGMINQNSSNLADLIATIKKHSP